MKMNIKENIIITKLLIFLFVLGSAMEIRGAPVSTNGGYSASLVTCPPPSGMRCYWEPEDTCTDHSDCQYLSADAEWIGLCCPHICKGKSVCRDIRLPKPSTTNQPTTKDITTTEYATRSSTRSTKSSTTNGITKSKPTNPVTTKTKNQFTTTAPSTERPSTTTSAERYSSSQKPSTTESQTTTEEKKSTITLPTTDVETTTTKATTERPTSRPTTTQAPITTEILATTVLSSSPALTTTVATTPTTQEPSVCSKADPKDILFIIDGTADYQQYWMTIKNEWNQIKQFIKEVVLELNTDSSRIGVMQYGGRREPKMEIDLWERTGTADLMYRIDNMRQIGRTRRMTGEALAMATNKFYEVNSIYERGNEQDIIVLITRGRPFDREQTIAEAEMLKRKMIRVIAIGVGHYTRYFAKSLRNVASFAQDAIETKYGDIASKKTDVLEKICLPVTLPGTKSICQNKIYDIYFVLDGSRSINPSDFEKKRKFFQDVFFLMDSPSSELHIGMMQFSTVENTETILGLQKHSLNEELQSIENMEYHAGSRTMLGDALNRVNHKVFNGYNGDRSAVENVLVIFSDGRAHDIRTAYREANYMKERNIRIITMVVSEYGDVPDNLRRLASVPKYAISIKLSNAVQSAKKLVSMICKGNN